MNYFLSFKTRYNTVYFYTGKSITLTVYCIFKETKPLHKVAVHEIINNNVKLGSV